MKPQFAKAATKLKELNENVVLAKIDCEDASKPENQQKCTELEVQMFPTMFWYE